MGLRWRMIKRGVSPVIATVLLLVLTIVIGGIIFSVVIPFVKDRLGESKMCLDVFDIKPEMNVRDDLRMVGSGSYNDSVGFPSVGGQRSYVIKNKYLKAEISPITESGEVCAVTDVIEFTSCYRDVIL